MSRPDETTPGDREESTYQSYILDVRVVECHPGDGADPHYRFEAPEHRTVTFDDPEMATLYADVYFATNGFEEAGTGERGVPPEIVGAGRSILAAYFLTQPYTDLNWVASFFGKKPHRVERYVASVREQAQQVREGAREQGLA